MVLEGKTIPSSKTSIHDRKKVIKKSKTMVDSQEKSHSSGPKRSANGVGAVKTRIREIGSICKSRKKYERDSPTSKQEDGDEDLVWLFSKASPIQVNQQESFWLSSESLSPLYQGGDFKFMSPRDRSIDERLISLLSSYRGISFFDGSKANPIKEASLTLKEIIPEDSNEEEAESWLLDPLESTIDSSSRCSDSSSLFWDLDRTDLWVSLINLEGEDCKWISNVDSDSENLESDFPSPTYENKRVSDVHSSDVDQLSSSMRSVQDELSSELLSGSLDLDDMDFDEPLMWPFDDKYDSSYTSDFFCQSPRRGLGASTTLSKNNGGRKGHSNEWWNRRFMVTSGSSASKIIGFKRGSRRIIIASRNTKLNRSSKNSMKMMLSASKLGKKHKFGKGNLVMSAKTLQALSVVGIDEFNRWQSGVVDGSSDGQSSKYSTSSQEDSSTTTKSQSHSSSSSMDFDSSGLWVSLINLDGEDSQWSSDLETDWEEGLQSNFPSPSYKNKRNKGFFSTETKLPFQDELSLEILSDQMDADEPLFWPYAKDQNWSMAWDSFCASPHKGTFGMTTIRDGHRFFGSAPASIRVRMLDQRVGFNRSLVAVSGLNASKIIGFKRGRGKKNNASARRAKAMNSRLGRSVARKFAKNVGEKMDVIMENDVEGVTVETILGLHEFDGHEGLDMEFHTESFSILEE